MSSNLDQWNFYFGRVDGALASTFVNLSLIDRAPVPGFADCVFVSLTLRSPRDDGLSSKQEFDALTVIEDRLSQVIASQGGLFAGRVTHAGRRDFFAYFKEAQSSKRALLKFQAEFAHYQMDIGARTDPAWQIYSDYLYPNAFALQHIRNRDVLMALQRNGDASGQPRKIDHFAYFPDLDAAQGFAHAAREVGFTIADIGQTAGETDEVLVQFHRNDAPHDIDQVTDAIIGALQGAVGRYDGWGCDVQRPN